MTVVLSNAAVLYLWSGRRTPEKMEIELITSGGTVVFDIGRSRENYGWKGNRFGSEKDI